MRGPSRLYQREAGFPASPTLPSPCRLSEAGFTGLAGFPGLGGPPVRQYFVQMEDVSVR